jgi:bacteriophage HK97-gp10 putative tail-component
VDADVGAYHVVNQATLRDILQSPNGAVAKDMLRRAIRVQGAAKKNLNDTPRRIDTGRLRASITYELSLAGRRWRARIGTNVEYARYVHDGTGLYGPRHQYIVPRNRKVLRWVSRGAGKSGKGGYTYAMRSSGFPGNPFLRNALKAVKD